MESQIDANRLRNQALDLSERSDDPRTIARVRLTFARSITYNASLQIIKSGEIDETVQFELQSAHNLAMQAAEFYAQACTPRDFVVAYNAAAQAAAGLNDVERRDELTTEATRIASQFGYSDLIEIAASIAGDSTPLEVHRAAQETRSPYMHDPTEVTRVIDAMIDRSGVSDSEAARLRAALEAESADLAILADKRNSTCQFLELLRDKSPLMDGSLGVEPEWQVTCRARGIVSLETGVDPRHLLRNFATEHCSHCRLRSPGIGTESRNDSLEAIYAPLMERLAY